MRILLILIIGLMVGSILAIPLIKPFIQEGGKGSEEPPAVIQQPDPLK
ncbi:putative membrane protein (plasmid) [Rhizobium favelukesii]|uniref:Membrane protein n=1 Tax=Rhizobium favelukesii TaxID=348824 RepID=W6RPF2_9HYPH|nr:putative membrane protein [Rhizobium favelukesii]